MHENWASIDSESSNELLDEGWELDHEGMRRQSLRKLSVELYHIGSDLKADNASDFSAVFEHPSFDQDPLEAKPPSSPLAPFYYLKPKQEDTTVHHTERPTITTTSTMRLPLPNLHDLHKKNDGIRRVGAYSPESRKRRIQRFHHKRKNRVWHKKVKYDCRKTLAQFRPRYKGRFVKVHATA